MKVLYVHSGNIFGGVETLMLTLARGRDLCPEMEPHFALCFEGRFSEELSATGVPIYLLGGVRVSRPFSVLRARKRLRRLLRENQFDVVICHSAWGQAIFGPVIRAAKLPSVFWCHDVPDGRPWPERWAQLTPPDLMLCNSKYTAERVPGLYRDVPYELIYCPVEPQHKEFSGDQLSDIRSNFNTPTDAVVVLQISRMEPHKGHLTHLEALSKLRDLRGWLCWQVGDVQKADERTYFDTVIEASKRFGIEERVRFLGWQPDVRVLISASDIYCQPNVSPEPFGLTYIEALIAGKPVVATSIGGPKEIVDASCGFLVTPGDANGLAVALRTLIESSELRQILGAAGPERAAQLCDVKQQMRRLHQCLSIVFTESTERNQTISRVAVRSAQ